MTNDDTISRQAAIEELKGLPKYTLLDQKDCLRGVGIRLKFAEQALKNLPSAQPKSTEQIKWERDTAVEQLNELGYGLGEKIIHCKDCEYWGDEDNCPMCYTEKIEWDEGDGFIESEYILHNQADPAGYCNARMERWES